MNTQRRQKILGTLAADRIEKLDALAAEGKFVWSLQWVSVTSPSFDRDSSSSSSGTSAPRAEEMITVHQALWNQNYQSLLRYCEVHGHNNVPYHYSQASINGYPTPLHLGYWLHRYLTVHIPLSLSCTCHISPLSLSFVPPLPVHLILNIEFQWCHECIFKCVIQSVLLCHGCMERSYCEAK